MPLNTVVPVTKSSNGTLFEIGLHILEFFNSCCRSMNWKLIACDIVFIVIELFMSPLTWWLNFHSAFNGTTCSRPRPLELVTLLNLKCKNGIFTYRTMVVNIFQLYFRTTSQNNFIIKKSMTTAICLISLYLKPTINNLLLLLKFLTLVKFVHLGTPM